MTTMNSCNNRGFDNSHDKADFLMHSCNRMSISPPWRRLLEGALNAIWALLMKRHSRSRGALIWERALNRRTAWNRFITVINFQLNRFSWPIVWDNVGLPLLVFFFFRNLLRLRTKPTSPPIIWLIGLKWRRRYWFNKTILTHSAVGTWLTIFQFINEKIKDW